MTHRTVLTIALALALRPHPAASVQGAPSSVDPPVASAAARHASLPPTIDGRGNDPAWEGASPVTDFWQMEPDEGAEPSQPTEFRVAYDASNLYVLVNAFDTHPDSIVHALSRRDVRAPSDGISVVVDSYHDRRTGYEFAVNPDGVKRDNYRYNDGYRTSSWDGVWEVATAVTSSGWTAEFRIPLSQLRYPDAPAHTFGLGVYRTIERYPETVTWPRISRDRPGAMSQLATLEGLAGLSSSRTIELTPYLVAKSETEPLGAGRFGRSYGLDIGSDLKLRLTPNLTIDATVNPDFGQVEADPAVLNLDAAEVFVEERRPFFVEGTGLYRFALNCSSVNCTSDGLFYSRRIGRTPELRGQYGDASTPIATPIAAAAKLTGRTSAGLSFGALTAVTRRVSGIDDTTVEPLTNRTALTAEQDFREGDAGVRMIATAINRSQDEWSAPFLHESAYSALVSARSRFLDRNYEVLAWLAASRVTGSPEAIALTQQSAVHYYQQPGDDPGLDPLRTSLSGHAAQITVGKYGGGITRFQTSFVQHSAGFEVNDLGFLRRADFQDWSTWAALRFNDPTRAYRWMQVNGNIWHHWTTSGRRIQQAVNFNAHMGLHNNWDVHGGFTLDGLGTTFCDRCTRGGPPLRQNRGFHPWFEVNGDARSMLAPSLWVNLSFGDEGKTRSVSLSPTLNTRFSTRLDGSLGLNLRWNENDAQWIDNLTAEGGATRYIFTRLDQETVSANVRINCTVGPDLTVQFYGEPFVSTGDYTDFREISGTPGAAAYRDRFIEYAPPASTPHGFRFRQLRTNLVVRWEYVPGSTLYFAWAHGRQASGGPSDLSRRKELRDLFTIHPDNTFLIKVAHWLNW